MSWRDPINQARIALHIWPRAVGTVPDGLLRYEICELDNDESGTRHTWTIDARQFEPYLMPIFRSGGYQVQVFFKGGWYDWSEHLTFGVAWGNTPRADANLAALFTDAQKALLARVIVPTTERYPKPELVETVQCPRCPDGPGTGTDSRNPIAVGGDPCRACGGSSRIVRTSWPVQVTEEEAMDTAKLFDLANSPENAQIRNLANECRRMEDIMVATTPIVEATEQVSTGKDLPLTPEINQLITKALEPRKATVSNLVAPVVTTDEIAEEFHVLFGTGAFGEKRSETAVYTEAAFSQATKDFKGRRVVNAEPVSIYPTGTLFFVEGVESSGPEGLPVLALTRVVGGAVNHFILPRNPPMPLSTFLGCVEAVHHEDDFTHLVGTEVRIPYAVDHESGMVNGGFIAVCTSINFAIDHNSPGYTIAFEAPFGSFTHHTLRPESNKALPGHETRKTRIMHSFSKTVTRSIIKDYTGGTGLSSLGSYYGVSAATIKRVLTENSVAIRPQGRPINVANAYQAGAGLSSLAAKTGIPVKRLRQNLAAKGVKIRGVGRPKKSI